MAYGSKETTNWLHWTRFLKDMDYMQAYDGGAPYEGWGGAIARKNYDYRKKDSKTEWWVAEYSHCSCDDAAETTSVNGPFETRADAEKALSEYIRADVLERGDELGYRV